jgi:cytochrome c oxidase subunit III
MNATMTHNQNGKLHPRKLMMWMAMASMFMVFAGFTSAFLLQKGTRADWANITLPIAFWISTVVILVSSYTINKAVRLFQERQMSAHKKYITITLVLGILFMILQLIGFWQLYNSGIKLDGGVSGAFLYIISGTHILHMLAGVVAIFIVYKMAIAKSKKTYSSLSHEILALFWHFVDVLWVYLFIFFLINFKF